MLACVRVCWHLDLLDMLAWCKFERHISSKHWQIIRLTLPLFAKYANRLRPILHMQFNRNATFFNTNILAFICDKRTFPLTIVCEWLFLLKYCLFHMRRIYAVQMHVQFHIFNDKVNFRLNIYIYVASLSDHQTLTSQSTNTWCPMLNSLKRKSQQLDRLPEPIC